MSPTPEFNQLTEFSLKVPRKFRRRFGKKKSVVLSQK